jgi:predicted nucleic acid-binding protein
MRIYLDACCFNRPFDDPNIARNHLESEAIISIMNHVQQGEWLMIGSNVLEFELRHTPDSDRKEAVLNMLAAQMESVQVEAAGYNRAQEIVKFGFKPLDAMHVACAEAARCDVLLTTDDGILKKGAKFRAQLLVDIRNPVDWLLEQEP